MKAPITLAGCMSATTICLCQAQPVVVATPTTGELGSIIQLSVEPQTPGYEFSSETIGIWFGSYSSSAGLSPFFTTTYENANIVITDEWTAQIVLGSGVFASKIDPLDANVAALLAPNGSLNGTFQTITPSPCEADFNDDGILNFFDISAFLIAYGSENPSADLTGDSLLNFFDISIFLGLYAQGCGPTTITMDGPISMPFTAEPAEWHSFYYPGGWTSGSTPELISEVSGDLTVFQASNLPYMPQDDTILGAAGLIYAITLHVESNILTDAGSPATIEVDVFTVDGSGNEIDRLNNVILEHQGIVGGRVRYSSLTASNIMLTDIDVDDTPYSSVRTLRTVDGGNAYIVLSIGG